MTIWANPSVNTDRLQAALAGSLRRCAPPTVGYLKGYASLAYALSNFQNDILV